MGSHLKKQGRVFKKKKIEKVSRYCSKFPGLCLDGKLVKIYYVLLRKP